MKNLFTLFFACTLLVFTTNISAQLNSTNTNNLPAGTTPNLTKKTVSTDLSKIRTIRTGAISNSQLTEEIKENTIGRDATAIIYSNDTRNLPLNSNGNLVNPDGFEVNFVHPHAPDSTHWCWTPVPVTTDGNRDINCAFSVPCDNPANRDGANTATVKYFQLVWHVMRNGGASTNISQTTINNLMTELNADFAPHNMVFCANPANFYEDAANYNHDENTEEVTLKTAYNVTPTQVINIYVVGTMGPGGYARFPYDPMGGTSPTGGIVLNRGNCWVGSHTLAHEMGHVFGLEHTFAGVDERATCSNCYEKVRNVNGSSNATGVGTPLGGPYTNQGDREGDWCSDTNPHATNSYDCTNYTNPQQVCDLFAPANPPVNNHMSYSFCTSQFTAQQGRRMHCMVDSYLTSWTSYGGGICGALPPVADFVGSPTTWIDPATVTFTDLSAPAAIITTWTWNFNNAANPNATVTPATFVGQNPPPIVYDVTSGVCEVFEVSLTVSGPNGSDTETKTAYIEVCPPASDCSTLNTDWLTPAPTPTIYNGAFGYFTGVPNEGSALPQDPAGMYQQYFTPTPGTSVVGAVRVGLGVLTDPDDDMTFQVVVYEDDPGNPGFPNWIAGPVAFEAFSPTQLGIPGGLSFVEFWVPFECAPTIAGTTFHVGVEMFPGDATDELVLVSNANGQGGSPLTNTYNATFCASQDYNTNGMLCGYAAVNFDLLCYPMMGWWAPLPYASGFTETNVCDTTYATVFTGTFYDCNGTQSTQILNWTYTFSSNGTTISSATEVPALSMTYTTPGPDTLTITAINECGRADTTTWIIPYNLNATPATDFSMAQTNPVCLGTPINFTGQPNTGMYSYTWDFGNGTVIGPGNIPQSPAPAVGTFPSPTYTYPAIGTYYVDLTVSSYGLQPGGPPIFQEGFEVGWPGWTRRNGDALTPDPTMAALGFGTTAATSWLVLDVDGDGAMEATSTSWYTPPGTADDWFRTPLIAIPAVGKYGLFWTGESFSGTWPDGYEVRLRTGTVAVPNAANYPTVLFSTTGENAFETNHVVDLSPYAGQNISIAFRNNTFDGYMLLIDSIRVAPLSIACTANRRYLDFVEVVDCSVQPPVYTINANPTSGCVPLNVNFQSTLTGGAAATSFTWNFGDGGFAFVEDPGIHTYTTPGTYFVSLDVCNAGGCNTYYQTIIVDALPTTSNAGPDQNFCGGTTATLAGNVPATGTGAWTVIAGGGAVTTPGSANSGVTGLTPGANTFQWTITNGSCTSIDQVTININTPPNAGTNGSITLCSNSAPVNLFSSLGGTPSAGGTWSGPSALGGGSLGTYNPATAAPGVYTYTVTGVAPCANATATVTVTENAAPNAGTNGTITLCSNSAPVNLFSSLGGTPAAGGIWSGPSALGGGSLGTYNPATAAPGVYTYTVTGVAPCANATATVTVTENAAPNAGTNGSITLCSNSAPVNLFSSLGGTPAAGGTWSGPSALGGGSLGTYDPATATAGVYTYTVTGVAPCANATATVTVTENAAPNAGTNGSITLCSNSAPVNLFSSLGGTPAAGGTWSGPSALGGGSLGTYDPATATPGVYTYTVTGVAPCANATATVTVTENAAPNAGTNGSITLCSNSAPVNLFSSLGGTPAAGGTWSGPSALGGGSLGTYDPATATAGVYTYT
ncbi:MAG: PKD domain-containing protein, partial [Bacteroidota bacterium]